MLTLSFGIILICAALCGLLIAYDYIRNRLGLDKTSQQSVSVPSQLTVCPENYVPFLEKVFIPCVDDLHDECALAAPGKTALHIVPFPDCAMVDPVYDLVFCYDFKRQSYVEGGLDNLHTRYSTLPLEDIVGKLNGSLSKYAIAAGHRPCSIVDAKDTENGVVRFTVGVTP